MGFFIKILLNKLPNNPLTDFINQSIVHLMQIRLSLKPYINHNLQATLLLFLSLAVLNISIDTVNFTPFHSNNIAISFNEYNSILEFVSETITGNNSLIKDHNKQPSSHSHRAKVQHTFWAISSVQFVALVHKPVNNNYLSELTVNDYDNIAIQINIPPPKQA